MPKSIGHYLELGDAELKTLEGVTQDIGRGLSLYNVNVETMPANIKVPIIYVAPHQKELLKDLKSKGYNVMIL